MLFRIIPVVGVFLFLTGVFQVSELLRDMPPGAEIRKRIRPENWEWSTEILDHSGQRIGELYRKRRYPVPFDELPGHLGKAFLAAEDQGFYEHGALSLRDIIRALWSNLRSQERRQGASTITQQLARNLFLSTEKTVKRKILETALAFRLENWLSKDEILSLYLNRIYLGRGAYGVEAASRIYFGKTARALSLSESALLAALPKAPTALAPHRNFHKALSRRNLVLERMQKAGFISREQWQEAFSDLPKIETDQPASEPGFEWVTERVRKEITFRFAGLLAREGGLRIRTGIRKNQSDQFRVILSDAINRKNPERSGKFRLEAAHICVDQKTALISCLQGGTDFGISQFDRVFRMQRSIHTLSLPFIFSFALQNGVEWHQSLLLQEAGQGRKLPGLWDDLRYGGFDNARMLMDEYGPYLINRYLRQAGFVIFSRQGISAYRATEASPYELIRSFYQFYRPSQGPQVRLIESITTASGEVLYAGPPPGGGRTVLSDQVRLLVREALDQAGRDIQPLGGLRGLLSITPDRSNAWFVGESGGIIHSLWVGSEFGKKKLAPDNKSAKDWWKSLILSMMGGGLGRNTEFTQDSAEGPGKIGIVYGRYLDNQGISRTLPFRHL